MTKFDRWIGKFALLFGAVIGLTGPAHAEDGYDLWLRYHAPATASARGVPTVETRGDTPTLRVAAAELRRGAGLFGTSMPPVLLATASDRDVAALRLPMAALGDEGYRVGQVTIGGRRTLLVTANTDRGVLYGSFALLRHLQTGGSLDRIDLTSSPRVKLRVLNHWDNLDGVVERGYAGVSLWDWWTLPDFRDPRYTDYARANASLGINGTVLNNVNAKADSLTAPYIAKAAALADVFRPYGIKVYLSARFSAPIRSTRRSRRGGRRRPTRSIAAFRTLAASWSRRTARASRDRATITAATPTAPTCWRPRSHRMAGS
jgi:alpha-glucuronidase